MGRRNNNVLGRRIENYRYCTVDWYKKYEPLPLPYGNIDDALVAHPRMLNNTSKEVDGEVMMGGGGGGGGGDAALLK
jgi:hypothetical protein